MSDPRFVLCVNGPLQGRVHSTRYGIFVVPSPFELDKIETYHVQEFKLGSHVYRVAGIGMNILDITPPNDELVNTVIDALVLYDRADACMVY
jgi:hypothetical protein